MTRKTLPVLQPAASEPSAPPLASLSEANLGWDELDCVLADLDDFAEILLIIGKETSGSDLRLDSVERARNLLVGGELVALQLRYRFADTFWFDTFLRTDTGAALVRMPDAMEPE